MLVGDPMEFEREYILHNIPALMFVLKPGSYLKPRLKPLALIAGVSIMGHSADPNSELRLPVFGQSVSAIWKALLRLTLRSKASDSRPDLTWALGVPRGLVPFACDLARFLAPDQSAPRADSALQLPETSGRGTW